MKNKQHEFIMKAFVESKIPELLKSDAPELIMVDSILGGYCTQILGNGRPSLISKKIISNEFKKVVNELLNKSEGASKQELIIYYRLAILAETIVCEYCNK